jgi:Fe-S oxidoreductase
VDALKVIQSTGCNVHLLSIIGTGRTLISKGFLVQAKKHARKLIDEIKKIDPDGKLPVIGLEPSEIYTLMDEYLDFFPNDGFIKDLSHRSFLVDEFLLRPADDGSARVSKLHLEEGDKIIRTNVQVHGHCYQKAQQPAVDGYPTGVNATKALLQAVGYSVNILDDGCCGMAGAFGYEAEHYDLSIKVGKLSLFPAIINENQPVVAAAGISCKSQIEDGTGIKPYHPITLVALRCEGE